MPALLDENTVAFPGPEATDENGIIAIGGDLSVPRLLAAYSKGIFPWPHQDLPLLWFFPDPRYVLKPSELHIDRSLRKALKNTDLHISVDTNFVAVIKACRSALRPDQPGTWISNALIDAYTKLHHLGYAHSVEAYRAGELVGGLYGVSIGRIFFGESMFFKVNNASKICLVTLVAHLLQWNFSLIDCQMQTRNLEKFGAQCMSKAIFIDHIHENHQHPTKRGPWQFYLSPQQALALF